MRGRSKPQWGFTISELLIVASLFTIIGTVVAFLFSRGNSAYRHGESHIEMQRAGRTVVARVTPFISSVFNAASPTAAAIRLPATADPNIHENTVRFFTTEDWLAPTYPDVNTSSTLANSTADLRNFTYQILQDNNGNVVLQKLNEPTPDTFNVANTKVLVRRKADETISNLQFTLVRSNLLVMEFQTSRQTRGDGNQPMTVKEDFRITFNIPTKSV